jgi:hypothetical protein
MEWKEGSGWGAGEGKNAFFILVVGNNQEQKKKEGR